MNIFDLGSEHYTFVYRLSIKQGFLISSYLTNTAFNWEI